MVEGGEVVCLGFVYSVQTVKNVRNVSPTLEASRRSLVWNFGKQEFCISSDKHLDKVLAALWAQFQPKSNSMARKDVTLTGSDFKSILTPCAT